MKSYRLNAQTFASDKVALDILDAMRDAKRLGFAQYLENRKGSVWLRVDIKRDGSGRHYFEFRDRTGRSYGLLVRIAALTHWNLFVRRQFESIEASLLGDEWCYRATTDCHIIAATKLTPLNATQGVSPQ